MNATATYRMSTIITERPSVPRRRTFQPVDWPASKQIWQVERNSLSLSSTYLASDFVADDDSDSEPVPPYGPREGIKRMLTVFPVRDAAWITAVAFTVGSLSFTVASLVIILPIFFPPLAFDGQREVVFPAALTVGSASFFIGGNLATLGAFNVDRGPISSDEEKSSSRPTANAYNPALLGSNEWVWFPGWTEFRSRYLKNPAFCGGLVAMFGGYVLSTSTITGFPGVLDPEAADFPDQFNRLVMTPLIIGASLLGLGALILTLVIQQKWYMPAVTDIAWHSTFWNVAGAGWLAFSGVLTILGPEQELFAAIASTASSVLFVVASSLQWYLLMQHYPRRPSS
ncbi:integral membrane protein [Ophiocordyceps camponoti-floridani]|uniref:Integral membrane protein n=1 Tax=Ophiocordyceps camponoti-floridani TaxID=2030778 RepID=A0A8H4VCP6_9HYPO|nr:integral membrane protein [Ophiocordyceps camponoti-floridani]